MTFCSEQIHADQDNYGCSRDEAVEMVCLTGGVIGSLWAFDTL